MCTLKASFTAKTPNKNPAKRHRGLKRKTWKENPRFHQIRVLEKADTKNHFSNPRKNVKANNNFPTHNNRTSIDETYVG